MTRRIILIGCALLALMLVVASVVPLVTEVMPAVAEVPMPSEIFFLGTMLGLTNLGLCLFLLRDGWRQGR